MGVFALSLAGILHAWSIALWLATCAGLCWPEIRAGLRKLGQASSRGFSRPTRVQAGQAGALLGDLPTAAPLLGLLLAVIFILALFKALAPPSDYDGLMYHLQAPRLFLERGRIDLLPDLWQANGPLAMEMVFTIGLAFGSGSFASIVNLGCALLLVLATFRFGQRYLGRAGGWTAAAVLVGAPALPLWAAQAQVDIAWALYEFLAFSAFLRWTETEGRRWLVLAGALAGLALGTKYLALGGTLVLGLGVLWHAARKNRWAAVEAAWLFGGTALLAGSPWYLKNWLLAGNPLYPFLWGGPGWDTGRLDLLMNYLRGFGMGYGLRNFLALPWNLYAHHPFFGVSTGIELPGLLFPLALFYPLVRRSLRPSSTAVTRRPAGLDPATLNRPSIRAALDWAGGLGILRLGVWFLGSQQTRFLLPLFPILSLLAAAVILGFSSSLVRSVRLSYIGRLLPAGLAAGMAAVTLAVQALLFIRANPLPVLAGREPTGVYLARTVSNFRALEFIRSHLPAGAGVLMMWDGQGYYCDRRCRPDAEQAQWTRRVGPAPSVSAVAAQLHADGITHLLYSGDAELVARIDRAGVQQRAVEFFFEQFQPACAPEIYRDDWVRVYVVECGTAQE